jgi:alkanesulfonate monooxygenase SsuD/methylene tetrahydromethanopterin reductase-like flavin-dependent oxidoreductase (luciferase family)
MEFGMFHEFPSLEGRSETEAFDEAFEQVDAAERLGLDAMWLAEIHFAPERTVLSAPLSIASAIAGRTSRIKIGVAVQVLPLCHPLRLAEEAATVDQVSRGRLIFGVGRSGVVATYDAYGVPYEESRERFAEILAIVRRAWTEPRLTYDGKYHAFRDVPVAPRPYRDRLPPIRIAASTPDTFAQIGTLGYPIFASARHATWSALAPQIKLYQEAYRKAGHPGTGQVFVSAPTYIAASDAEARDEAEESIVHFYRLQYELIAESARRSGNESFVRRAEHLRTLTYAEILRGNVLLGSPETVARRLEELREELGLAGILAELNCGGLIPHARVLTALELLCTEIKPRFADGQPSGAARSA